MGSLKTCSWHTDGILRSPDDLLCGPDAILCGQDGTKGPPELPKGTPRGPADLRTWPGEGDGSVFGAP